MKNIVIIGGGIAGLMSAYILSENENYEITLIEQENEVGGLLKKYDYGEYGIFDYGMHNILETGINELDKLIFDLLPEDEWQMLEGNKRDLVGLFINGKLQKNSPYIDLREFDNYQIYLDDFFKNGIVKVVEPSDYDNAKEYLIDKYGEEITNNVLKDIVEKFYKEEIQNLDPLSTMVTPLGRVILLDELIMGEINKSEILRSKLGYPEQRNLDLKLSSGRKAYYPKNYGIYKVIDSLVNRLNKNGVSILLNTSIKSLKQVDQSIQNIELTNKSKLENIDTLVWSTNLFSLTNLLDIQNNNVQYDTPATTTVTNIVIDKKLKCDDLYYIYCYDKNMSTFRVTPYYNYCDGAQRAGGYPIAVEMLIYDDIDNKEKLTEKAINEIKAMDLLDDETQILFSTSEILKSGFPRPTINNMTIVDTLRKKINDMNISNLINIGILSEKNLFFQTDVLVDLYNKLRNI